MCGDFDVKLWRKEEEEKGEKSRWKDKRIQNYNLDYFYNAIFLFIFFHLNFLVWASNYTQRIMSVAFA